MLVRGHQLARGLVVEHVLKRAATLESPVLEAVGGIAHKTEPAAQILGCTDAELHPVSLQLIEAVD